jgi:hypothetical protein
MVERLLRVKTKNRNQCFPHVSNRSKTIARYVNSRHPLVPSGHIAEASRVHGEEAKRAG